MYEGARGGEVEESQDHPPSGLERGERISTHCLLTLVGGPDTLLVFSLLYADMFLSFSWALNLEREGAFSGNECFKELLLGSMRKLRIHLGGLGVRFCSSVFLLRCIS